MMRCDETGRRGVGVPRSHAGNSNGHTVDRAGTARHLRALAAAASAAPSIDGSSHVLADRSGQAAEFAQRRRGEVGRLDLVHRPDLRHRQRLRGRRGATPEIGACHVYRIDPESGAMTRGRQRHGAAERPRLLARREAPLRRRHRPTHDAERHRATSAPSRCRRTASVRRNGRACSPTATAGLFDGFRVDTDGQHLDQGRRRRPLLRARRHADRQDPGARGGRQRRFGGPKRNRLFICGTTSLYSLLLMVNGSKLGWVRRTSFSRGCC